jgi:hypothetical protein
MRGEARDDIGEPRLRVHAVYLGGDDEAIRRRGAMASKASSAQPTLCGVVREANAPVLIA